MSEYDPIWYICLGCWHTWTQGEMPCDCEADVLAMRGLAHRGRPVENVDVGDYL